MPTQPFLFLSGLSVTPDPEDNEDDKEFKAMIDKELRDCSRGTLVSSAGFRHDSYTDLPLLRAAGSPGGTAKLLDHCESSSSYTHAFFDKFLNGAHTLLDREPAGGSKSQNQALYSVDRSLLSRYILLVMP